MKTVRDKYKAKQAYADYETEMKFKQLEAQNYYLLLVNHFKCNNCAIYEDAIIDTIGKRGLNLLREFRLIEGCGSINGRKLYAI